MSIRRLTPKGSARDFVERQIAMRRAALIEEYRMVGEEALTIARTQHRYTRQTGNLTSSTGYCILDDGRIVERSGFEVVKSGKDGAEEGRKFLQKLIDENSKGLVFIMVAGMPYAQYVEAMDKDVLDSAEVFSKKKIRQVLKKLKIG